MIYYKSGYESKCDENSKKSYEECLQIAQNKLQEFDEGTYKQVREEQSLTAIKESSYGEVFYFYFVKVIDDKESNIIAGITVNTDGLVIQLDVNLKYEFSDKDEVLVKNYTQTDEELLEEIKNRLVPELQCENMEDISFEIYKKTFCKLKDGDVYIECEVEISSAADEGSDYVRVLKQIS